MSSVKRQTNCDTFAFADGDRVVPSDEGLKTFPRWVGRRGTILYTDEVRIFAIRWDGRKKVDLIHADFLRRVEAANRNDEAGEEMAERWQPRPMSIS